MRSFALDATPRAARELTRRSERPVHDRRDLVERHANHIVQHEGEPLRGLEGLQHHEEREADRVGEHGIGFRIPVGASDHWIGHVHIQGIPAARFGGAVEIRPAEKYW